MGKFRGHKKSSGPKKPPLTHFLCLPLISAESRPLIKASLEHFKDDVTSSPTDQQAIASALNGTETSETKLPVIHPKAVRPVGALHLTLGVMSLDQTRLDEAVDFLRALDIKDILEKASTASNSASASGAEATTQHSSKTVSSPVDAPRPLKLDLKGLESMHPPQNTSILYTAPSDPTSRLYPFCLALQEAFKEKGFLVNDERKLKLHATLINTIYATGRSRPAKSQIYNQTSDVPPRTQGINQSQGHGTNANAPLKIDARGLIEKYAGFSWAKDVVLERLAICEMGAKKVTDGNGNVVDERYTEVATVPLPT